MSHANDFFALLESSFLNKKWVKCTVSKPKYKSQELRNIYLRLVELKGELKVQVTFRYQTNDQVKNFGIEDTIDLLKKALENDFSSLFFVTTENEVQLMVNKKGHYHIKTKNTTAVAPNLNHNRVKKQYVEGAPFLNELGITDQKGELIPKMADKLRQINKYLEIMSGLMQPLLKENKGQTIRIVDMGSGKGYLTFALYHYMTKVLGVNVEMLGVELRAELVDFCNQKAKLCDYNGLAFVATDIASFSKDKIDILIALHACDTATDDALNYGIQTDASLIVCAPCCHKQVRKAIDGNPGQHAMLQYGIFKERTYEMLTDTIRALLLEKQDYNTHIFEFVSNEHTRKNIMLTAQKKHQNKDVLVVEEKIKTLKKSYGLDKHYLEGLLESQNI